MNERMNEWMNKRKHMMDMLSAVISKALSVSTVNDFHFYGSIDI